MFQLEHGTCPTCGRCRCCGQNQFSPTGWDINTTQLDLSSQTLNVEEESPVDKLMRLISSVRGDSSFPLDKNIVEDIINGQTETE